MRSIGILFLFFLVLGCSAQTQPNDPAVSKIVNAQVTAILDAIKAKDQSTLKGLFIMDPISLQSIGEFIENMQGVQITVKTAYIEPRDGSTDSTLVMADKIPGFLSLKKNSESKTGWQVSGMWFNKNTGDQSDNPPAWVCGYAIFKCILAILEDWKIGA